MNTFKKSKLEGEGDYEAARSYRSRTAKFLRTHDIAEVARAATPKSTSDAQEMKTAEAKGRARAQTKAPTKKSS